MNGIPHVIFLPLTKGFFATVDSTSPESVWGVKWSAYEKRPGRVYAFRSVNGRHETLHHAVLGLAIHKAEVDHINGDTLDTRKQNLRVCRHCQNGRNLAKWTPPTSSKYKGVSRRPNGGWRAYIVFKGKQKHLGIFDSEVEAASAYDEAAKECFGEFARLNLSAFKLSSAPQRWTSSAIINLTASLNTNRPRFCGFFFWSMQWIPSG